MLGFVILSHSNPKQLVKLINTLNQLYGFPPIACHHDFSQSSLNISFLPSNVWFVSNYYRTSWGHWSVTGGAIKALQLLYGRASPEWFVLLSSADYPISSAEDLYDALRKATVDAFLDLRPVVGAVPERHIGTADLTLSHHNDLKLAVERYMHARIALPRFSWLQRSRLSALDDKDDGRHQPGRRMPFVSPVGPFDSSYRCYVGSQWFTANRRAAMKLIQPNRRDEALRHYYQVRWHADESYVNTVLGNAEDITIDIDPRRFSRWEDGSAHPRLLIDSDLNAMLSSDRFFARKFSCGANIINRIDAALQITD